MKLLSTDRSTESNYHHFAISRIVCAGIIQGSTSGTVCKSQCCFTINFCRAEKDSDPGGFLNAFVHWKIFVSRISMVLKRKINNKKKPTNKPLFSPFSTSRNENFKQERLTDLTSGEIRINYSRNPVKKKNPPFAAATEKGL